MNKRRDLIERIKREVSIMRLLPEPVVDSGDVVLIRCPFFGHEDKNPSCAIFKATNSFYCFSHTGKPIGGSVIDFVMHLHGLDFWGAVRFLVDFMGWTLDPPSEEERAAEAARHKREETLGAVAHYAHGQLIADTDVAKQGREYLAGRGFGLDLLREHQVGLLNLAKLYKARATHPLLADFSEADFDAAGLRNTKGNLIYSNTRFVFALTLRQRVVGATFRALPGAEAKHKFIQLAGQPAGLWNQDALCTKEGRLVFCEGPLDGLTLSGFGIPVVGNMGLEVAKNAHLFAHLKEVTVVFDNDKPGQTRAPKAATDIQRAMKNGVVKILTLPDHNDVNDWARAGGTKDEFLALWKQAPDLVTVQIQRLPMERDTIQDADIDDLLDRIRTRPLSGQPHLLELLKERTGVSKTTLRSRMAKRPDPAAPDDQAVPTAGKAPKQERAQTRLGGIIPPTSARYRTGLDVFEAPDGPVLHMGFTLEREIVEGENGSAILGTEIRREWLRAQERDGVLQLEFIPVADLDKDAATTGYFPTHPYPQWSLRADEPFSLPSLLEDPTRIPASRPLYQKIRDCLGSLVWLPDARDLDLLVLWILMTYVYPVFNAVPYLHFNGTKGSGKSTSLGLVSSLSFSGMKGGHATESAVSLHCSNTTGTVAMDEAERLMNPHVATRDHDLQQIVILGYQRNAHLPKGNMEIHKTELRDIFGPKCLASIGPIHHVPRDRCIQVLMRTTPNDVQLQRSLIHTSLGLESELRALRNELHTWGVGHFTRLHQLNTVELVEAHKPQLLRRLRELWMPILTIAHLIDEESTGSLGLVELMLGLQRSKHQDNEEREADEDPQRLYLAHLLPLLEESGGREYWASNSTSDHRDWYSLSVLLSTVESNLQALRLLPTKVARDVTWFRRLLLAEGLILKGEKRQIRLRRRGESAPQEMCYRIAPEAVARVRERLSGSPGTDGLEGSSDGGLATADLPAPAPLIPLHLGSSSIWDKAEGVPF